MSADGMLTVAVRVCFAVLLSWCGRSRSAPQAWMLHALFTRARTTAFRDVSEYNAHRSMFEVTGLQAASETPTSLLARFNLLEQRPRQPQRSHGEFSVSATGIGIYKDGRLCIDDHTGSLCRLHAWTPSTAPSLLPGKRLCKTSLLRLCPNR